MKFILVIVLIAAIAITGMVAASYVSSHGGNSFESERDRWMRQYKEFCSHTTVNDVFYTVENLTAGGQAPEYFTIRVDTNKAYPYPFTHNTLNVAYCGIHWAFNGTMPDGVFMSRFCDSVGCVDNYTALLEQHGIRGVPA